MLGVFLAQLCSTPAKVRRTGPRGGRREETRDESARWFSPPPPPAVIFLRLWRVPILNYNDGRRGPPDVMSAPEGERVMEKRT